MNPPANPAAGNPALSVILVASSDWRHIQKTVRHLRVQTCAAVLELVIAASDPESLNCDPADWQGFHSVQWVRTETEGSASLAKVRAIQDAHAPIIAFCEDHVFPEPKWAEALLAAHRQAHAAVAVALRNGNPSAVSRAEMMLSFGQWIVPVEAGVRTMLPGHNTSYKRHILAQYQARLRELMDSEAVFHHELVQKGETLYLATEAVSAHLNISRWRPFYAHSFLGGWVFGGVRRSENRWGLAQRIGFALGAPLVPVVRFRRMLPDLRRTGAFVRFDPVFWFALVTGLMAHAAGEAMGYMLGVRDAPAKYAPIELHRAEQLIAAEQPLAFQ